MFRMTKRETAKRCSGRYSRNRSSDLAAAALDPPPSLADLGPTLPAPLKPEVAERATTIAADVGAPGLRTLPRSAVSPRSSEPTV